LCNCQHDPHTTTNYSQHRYTWIEVNRPIHKPADEEERKANEYVYACNISRRGKKESYLVRLRLQTSADEEKRKVVEYVYACKHPADEEEGKAS